MFCFMLQEQVGALQAQNKRAVAALPRGQTAHRHDLQEQKNKSPQIQHGETTATAAECPQLHQCWAACPH